MSDGHNAKTCTRKLMCSSCKGNHPTPLHEFVLKDKRSTDFFFSYDEPHLQYKPVKVKHEHRANEVTTCAMLDNCSQGPFIHDSLLKKLGVNGSKTTVHLKTLHGQ